MTDSTKKLSSRQRYIIGYGILLIILIAGSLWAFRHGIHSIENAYQTANKNTYNNYYKTAYKFAEAQNHVSNTVSISVENARELSRLEVLTVTSSEFIIKNADENDKTISWLEVQGTGKFTVDLSTSEFITDSERHYVLVRIPKPVLTECEVSGIGTQFFKNNQIFSNGSIDDGIRLSQSQLSEGRLKLEDSMKQNRTFYDAARKAAVQAIDSLVHEWNPNISDLQVEIEFINNNEDT